jgi:hypothetical protein
MLGIAGLNQSRIVERLGTFETAYRQKSPFERFNQEQDAHLGNRRPRRKFQGCGRCL